MKSGIKYCENQLLNVFLKRYRTVSLINYQASMKMMTPTFHNINSLTKRIPIVFINFNRVYQFQHVSLSTANETDINPNE